MHRTTSLLIVLLLLLAGCAGGDDPVDTATPTPVPLPQTPSALPSPTAGPVGTPTATAEPTPSGSATDEPTGSASLDIHVVRDGAGQLWIEPVAVPYDPDAVDGAVARQAFTELLALADPPDGTTSLVPPGTQLVDVDLDGTVLVVDLSGEVADNPGAGAAAEAAFAQQLAHTGAQFPTVESVQVRVEGAVTGSLWGHVDWSQPIQPDPFALSPIIVDSVEGGTSSLSLTGTANVFEAVVLVTVTGPDGAVVEDTTTMASCGTGCRGDWTYQLDGLDPGTHTVELREEDISGGEGRPPFTVTTTVEVG